MLTLRILADESGQPDPLLPTVGELVVLTMLLFALLAAAVIAIWLALRHGPRPRARAREQRENVGRSSE
ncbi:hypothetical protein [Nocardioides sp. LHG3406-4]|uniref:hypothetical protein n=1 Tax=Nocardioides sp. LHG3406-4 TaxID=2804575 RepID=UPI003CF9BE79